MTDDTLAFRQHDHARCQRRAADEVMRVAAERGLRMTESRRRVLEILLEAHEALGAYEVLRRMTPEGTAPQPPVAYRALDFLVEHGFAHRIERLNAFVACTAPGEPHDPAFMICSDCRAVAELPGAPLTGALDRTARRMGFDIDRAVVEAEGICPGCRERKAP